MARAPEFNLTSLSNRRAFTLVELVVVVLILGILAGVAVPAVINKRNEATIVATIADTQAIEDAAQNFRAKNGTWPRLTYKTDNPGDFDPYIAPKTFTKQLDITEWTNYGWVWYPDILGHDAVIFTRSLSPPWSLWQEIDERYDDGDLLTGSIYVHVNQFLMFVVDE